MRSIAAMAFGGLSIAVVATAIQAGQCGSGTGCTGGRCEARCRAAWEEQKTKQPAYEIRGEYACARGRDPWHAPEPECRCRPPCGQVYVKKRLYKSEGEEIVERVPRYEVAMVPAEPCGCDACRRGGRHAWDPFGILAFLFPRH
ncbi:MAG: hypothetical protein ACKOCX_13445 [Planctomycetota bacterium]